MQNMLALSLIFVISVILPSKLKGQSVSINQQQQNININVPVIEKPVYIERYRTVYVDKPRVARKLDKPVLLLGYLWVYPEDLGNFKQIPVNVINSVNAQKPYGRDNWRIPTPDELAVLEANAEKIGLGDDIYLATDHCNGVLRMVSTGFSKAESSNAAIANGEVKSINGVLFRFRPLNPQEINPREAYAYVSSIPIGWRLPNENEIHKLMSENDAESLYSKLSNCYVSFDVKHYGGPFGRGSSYSMIRILYTNVLNQISVFEICRDNYEDSYQYSTQTIDQKIDYDYLTGLFVFVLPVLDN